MNEKNEGMGMSNILDLLSDEKWHSVEELAEVSTVSEDDLREIIEFFQGTGVIEVERGEEKIQEIKGKKLIADLSDLPEETSH